MTRVWHTTDASEHESGRHDEGYEDGSGCPYPTVVNYRAYEAEDERDDGDERNNCAEFRPVNGGLVGNWDGGMDGELFSERSGFKATVRAKHGSKRDEVGHTLRNRI